MKPHQLIKTIFRNTIRHAWILMLLWVTPAWADVEIKIEQIGSITSVSYSSSLTDSDLQILKLSIDLDEIPPPAVIAKMTSQQVREALSGKLRIELNPNFSDGEILYSHSEIIPGQTPVLFTIPMVVHHSQLAIIEYCQSTDQYANSPLRRMQRSRAWVGRSTEVADSQMYGIGDKVKDFAGKVASYIGDVERQLIKKTCAVGGALMKFATPVTVACFVYEMDEAASCSDGSLPGVIGASCNAAVDFLVLDTIKAIPAMLRGADDCFYACMNTVIGVDF